MLSENEINDLVDKCIKDPTIIDTLSEEYIDIVIKKIKLYGTITYSPKNDFTCFSITNLRESYMKRLLMLSIVGFTYRCLDEYNGCDNKNKEEIKKFLDSIFEFDPDYHVKKSSKKKSDIETVLNEDNKIDKIIKLDNIPADTFYRIDNYININYECIRNMVEDIYVEKPDFDYIINIYDSFRNRN